MLTAYLYFPLSRLSSTLSNTSLEDESERNSYSDEVNFNKRYTKETNFEEEKPRRDNANRKTYDLENERLVDIVEIFAITYFLNKCPWIKAFG